MEDATKVAKDSHARTRCGMARDGEYVNLLYMIENISRIAFDTAALKDGDCVGVTIGGVKCEADSVLLGKLSDAVSRVEEMAYQVLRDSITNELAKEAAGGKFQLLFAGGAV